MERHAGQNVPLTTRPNIILLRRAVEYLQSAASFYGMPENNQINQLSHLFYSAA